MNLKSFIIGVVASAFICIPISFFLLAPMAYVNPQLDLVDFLDLILTLLIAIFIPTYIQKWIDNKKIIKELIVADIKSLIDVYCENTVVLINLHNEEIEIKNAQNKIMVAFSKGDLIQDGIKKQLANLGNKDLENISIIEKTNEYHKFLTGGKFYNNDFKIDKSFIYDHEISLKKTTTELKLIIQKIILS